MVEVLGGDAGLVQAVLNRADGETGPVFLAVEAFLFDGGDQHAVADDGGGGAAVVGVDTEDEHGLVDSG